MFDRDFQQLFSSNNSTDSSSRMT